MSARTKSKRNEQIANQAQVATADPAGRSPSSWQPGQLDKLHDAAGNAAVSQLVGQPALETFDQDNLHSAGEKQGELKPLPSANATHRQASWLPPGVRSFLNSSQGLPLDPTTRADMESRFGYDFSDIRIHTNNAADHTTKRLNAEAFTTGRDIVFGAGRFMPQLFTGKRLLAHELAHVIQQSESGQRNRPILNPSRDAHERAANMSASRLMSDTAPSPPSDQVARSVSSHLSGSSSVPIIQRMSREETLDRQNADLIRLFYVEADLSEDSLLSQTDILINRARKLHQHFEDDNKLRSESSTAQGTATAKPRDNDDKSRLDVTGPHTRSAAAKALLKIFEVLKQRERAAIRDDENVLLFEDGFYGLMPWTPERPHVLGDIHPFQEENVQLWESISNIPLGSSSEFAWNPSISADLDQTQLELETQSDSPSRLPRFIQHEEGQGSYVYTFELIKTHNMSFKSTEGQAAIVAKAILQVEPRPYVAIPPWELTYSEPEDSLDYEVTAFNLAKWLLENKRIQITPTPSMTMEEYTEKFEKKMLGETFLMPLHPSFIDAISEFIPVKYHIREGRDRESRTDYITKARSREETDSGEKSEAQPDTAIHEIYKNNTPEEKFVFALARIQMARKQNNRYVPGRQYESGNIFIYHPHGFLNHSVWMTSDGRLFEIDERKSQLLALAQAGLSARGSIVMSVAMLVAVATIFTGFALAPALPATLPEAYASFYVWLVENPALAVELATFAISTGVQIKQMGVGGFLDSLTTAEGAVSFLYDVAGILAARGGGRSRIDYETDTPTPGPKVSRPPASATDLPDDPVAPRTNPSSNVIDAAKKFNASGKPIPRPTTDLPDTDIKPARPGDSQAIDVRQLSQSARNDNTSRTIVAARQKKVVGGQFDISDSQTISGPQVQRRTTTVTNSSTRDINESADLAAIPGQKSSGIQIDSSTRVTPAGSRSSSPKQAIENRSRVDPQEDLRASPQSRRSDTIDQDPNVEGIVAVGRRKRAQLIRFWRSEEKQLRRQRNQSTSTVERADLQNQIDEARNSRFRLERQYPPSPKQAEREARILSGGGDEIVFIHGRVADKRVKGSRVPDITPKGLQSGNVEVKRYLLDGSRRKSAVKRGQLDHSALDQMVDKVKEQVQKGRSGALPYDTRNRQGVIIDLRGQRLSKPDIQTVRRKVSKGAGIPIDAVEVIVDGGKRMGRRPKRDKKREE